MRWGLKQAEIYQDYQTMAQLLAAAFGDGKSGSQKVVQNADELASLFKTNVRTG